MDPGGLGAIIGIGVMAVFCICFRVYDIMEERKKSVSVTTPLLVSQSPPPQIKPVTHWKVNTLFKNQKKTILLKNLNSMSASRSLTSILNEQN